MITEVKERRAMTERDARFEYDGKWFLFDDEAFPPSEFKGYVVAYGDGSAQDRDALNKILWDKYNGRVFLIKGYKPNTDIEISWIQYE